MDIRGTLRWLSLRLPSHHSRPLPNSVDQKSYQASEKVEEHQLNIGRKCCFWIDFTYCERGVLENG